jgi:hypothetical protein
MTTGAAWHAAPDGAGHSLVLSRPSFGEKDPRAWSASPAIGGSPGAFDHYQSEPADQVVINEFLAHTDEPQEDYIELFNTGTQAVNVSGMWLSDTAATNKFRIPDGTTIPARGFLAFTQTQLGFSLSADGEKILLVNSNRTRVIDAVAFDGQANGVSAGRHPDGAPGFQPLASVTPGTANQRPRVPDVVINEIMYHPISESDDDEYVEIYNRSDQAVSLANWRLQGGVSFTFPPHAVIPADGYVVVGKNLARLLEHYAQLNLTNAWGNYSGSLRNRGERIALARPEDLVSTNSQGVVTTNLYFIVEDEVAYRDGGRWGKWSDGGGSSLELKDRTRTTGWPPTGPTATNPTRRPGPRLTSPASWKTAWSITTNPDPPPRWEPPTGLKCSSRAPARRSWTTSNSTQRRSQPPCQRHVRRRRHGLDPGRRAARQFCGGGRGSRAPLPCTWPRLPAATPAQTRLPPR